MSNESAACKSTALISHFHALSTSNEMLPMGVSHRFTDLFLLLQRGALILIWCLLKCYLSSNLLHCHISTLFNHGLIFISSLSISLADALSQRHTLSLKAASSWAGPQVTPSSLAHRLF